MRHATRLALAALVLVLAAGCEKTTSTDAKGRKLTLLKPMDQALKRGELNKVNITIGREGFSAPVEIRFENLPRGLQVVEKSSIAGDRNMQAYTLHADNDAALVANQEVRVVAEGPEGLTASETFKVTVKEKDQAASSTGN